ncbi:MAG: RsbRD N-terminal domain-containing protein [Candidatus Magnetominusculus sp. LBB02]|nr:RsbRD N-terminal domain-containing protein [Candidatus Magnetominusculus sp. LBB02]
MKLRDILLKERNAILDGWYKLILGTYPIESRVFLAKKNDAAANPVGHVIAVSIEGILQELLSGMDTKRMASLLDDIIRVRAVQDCCPSEAISLILLLKQALRDAARGHLKGEQLVSELLAFEDEVDRLTLLSFDIFMKCREDIFDLKVNELRRSTFLIAKRLNHEKEQTQQKNKIQEVV